MVFGMEGSFQVVNVDLLLFVPFAAALALSPLGFFLKHLAWGQHGQVFSHVDAGFIQLQQFNLLTLLARTQDDARRWQLPWRSASS